MRRLKIEVKVQQRLPPDMVHHFKKLCAALKYLDILLVQD
jgi:hypothetical protein